MSPHWKGKARDDSYGNGATDGIVLPLDMLITSSYDAVYTLPISVGASSQALSIQVDTGSSDLWIASTSCSTQACKQTNGNLYDPSQAQSTGQTFQISYVEGAVSGPIVWDTVTLGGYEIDGQALAAATSVSSEPLSPDFSGILGLALPANSIIASDVPPTTSSQPDGAVLASNLFTISPHYMAPSYRFISLTLARPDGGNSSVPSLLGLGRHPSQDVVPDPSKVQYSTLAVPSGSTGSAPRFWQTTLNGINVYVDGVQNPVNVGSTATAIVDSGMPVILASQDIANGIYGALGIGPGSDGQYYVPCTTPLNISVSLDSRSDIPLHPLDLTYSGQAYSGSLVSPSGGSSLLASGASVSSASSSGSMCLGLIQAYPPTSDVSSLADVILGVPFMRSVYTVMAYDPPDSNGAFPNATTGPPRTVNPRLGLLGLIDPSVALEEFNQERVLNEPLPATPGSGGSGGSTNDTNGSRANVAVDHGKKMTVGVEVLLGLLGFVALLFGVFGSWWLVQRRRRQRERRAAVARSLYDDDANADGDKEKLVERDAIYMLARRSTLSSRYGPSEDTLRARRFEEHMKQRRESEYDGETLADAPHHHSLPPLPSVPVPVPDKLADGHSDDGAAEFGVLPPRRSQYYADEPTLVHRPDDDGDGNDEEQARLMTEYPPSPAPTRAPTLEADAVAVPLLAHTRADSSLDLPASAAAAVAAVVVARPAERVPLGMGRPRSRARVGSFGERCVSGAGGFGPERHASLRTVSGPRPMSATRRSSGSSSSSSRPSSGGGVSVRRLSGVLSGQPAPPTAPSSPTPPPSRRLSSEPALRLTPVPFEESSAGHEP
ncbi:uncharacterized protein PHACADRAFT_264924 [Phanerochaete carnosa HHB-10118-sp]|uniref:Peptidase A1 domain-containing protein n=1 Tax=Phanerochaete carnosa (strain HHB-10118-sp) TaxID=650164 RepID=K5VU67_PHACS|nr:uncharacterized protein PHACADRAFT_264924 [Phanerochaete carnosa HHB-10118-sp]EKM50305.1 hypothetical protein PHACADRAFT_264924 [Phanerochaete carnosa HHB-10118-sp]